VILTFNKFLIYSEKSEKAFFSTFKSDLNIIYGRNTSGKSTLVQAMIYALGINDSKENLSDLLSEDVMFRLDCTYESKNEIGEISFVRKDNFIAIKNIDGSIERFEGILENTSNEYKRFKKYFSKMIGFDLHLESKGELVDAPLEVAFLPYYISQSVGWVYIRESIGDYRFYRNFKYDYLDYFLGINSGNDKIGEGELRKKKQKLVAEIKFLDEFKESRPSLKVTEAIEGKYNGDINDFVESFRKINEDLIATERSYTELCNQKSLLMMRRAALNKVKRNQQKQRPSIDCCPVCEQTLPSNISYYYKFKQELNDTVSQIKNINDYIKECQSKINSEFIKINKLKEIFVKDFKVLRRIEKENFSLESWVDHNANVKFLQSINVQKESINKKILNVDVELSRFKTPDQIESERLEKEREFYELFSSNLKLLDVALPNDKKYKRVYDITSFPFQGVELHKTIMAYHFAFNKLIFNNPRVHKLPFILDAIFKEDIESKSKEDILKFIASEMIENEQMFFSVADYKTKSDDESQTENLEGWVNKVNRDYFNNKAKLICIGGSISKRALLQNDVSIKEDYLEESLSIIYDF